MKTLLKIIIAFVLIGVIGIISAFVLYNYVARDIPEVSSLRNYNPPTVTRFRSHEGKVLLELATEKRILKEIYEIPTIMKDAVVSAEDSKFYEHDGIDYAGWVRTIAKVIQAGGRFVQGASTLTMQVARTFLLTREKKIIRKLREMILAKRIEKKFSKDEILYLYLNQVFFGSGYHGVGAAAQGYFGKDLADITVAEAALIAGVLPAPSRYSPFRNPKLAKIRQKYVLKRMLETQRISQDEHDRAVKERVKLQVKKNVNKIGSYYTDYLRWKLIDELGEKSFMSQGFDIQTFMDFELQQAAEKFALDGAKRVDKKQGYKGALKKIPQEEINNEIQKLKTEIYRKEAPLVLLNYDGSTSYQYSEDDLGQSESLKFFLKEGENYKAIVTEVDEANSLVYISIGGVPAFIDKEGFNWAKERQIAANITNKFNITSPSEVFSVGDLILAKIEKKESQVWNYLSRESKRKLNSLEKDKVKNQNIMRASLDQVPDVQVALLSMSAETGEVYAMVGGTDFKKSQFNRAIQAKRQPGSAFKPFIFSRALEKGFTPASIIMDTPHALAGFDVNLSWKPRNSDGRFVGPISFRRSLETSRNIPAIKVLQEVGVDKVIKFANRLGFKAKFPEDLGISLGSFGLSLKELTEAYTIFPSGGKLVQSNFINKISLNF